MGERFIGGRTIVKGWGTFKDHCYRKVGSGTGGVGVGALGVPGRRQTYFRRDLVVQTSE